jgi:toxin ParE1/3/4
MSRFVFHPGAERDIDEAATWYEIQQEGLGRQFRETIEAAFESIRLNPTAYARIRGPYRRFVVHRFPYNVVYRPSAGALYILSVSHGHRDPAHWQKRL